MKLVLISGKAGAGKDSLAEEMKIQLEAQGKKVLITHYADPLKFICKTYFGWDGMKDKAGRQLLQYVGTDVIRAQDPDFWVRIVLSILKMFPNEWDYVLIPDARFPNEVVLMADEMDHVVSVRIERPGLFSALTKEQQAHPSETALEDYEFDFELEILEGREHVIAAARELIKIMERQI